MLVFEKFGFKKFGCIEPADEASDFVEITARGYLVESIATTVKARVRVRARARARARARSGARARPRARARERARVRARPRARARAVDCKATAKITTLLYQLH